MIRARIVVALATTMILTAGVAPVGHAASSSRPAAPTVIAITEQGGFNVLHHDYRWPTGVPHVMPTGVPSFTPISLPKGGDFASALERAEQGPLGHLERGRLYYVRGTRVFVYAPRDSADNSPIDLFADPTHATGTTSAAIGLRHGTSPSSFLVYVPDASEDGWRWLAHQPWIDIVSTSYYDAVNTDGRCRASRYVKSLVAHGHEVFSASGNVEQAGALSSPAGVPEAYQVGGVDSQGRTYVPGVSGTEPSISPTRPYETGDRFDFPAAATDSFSGEADFGGTSGAAPSTAGRAATLVALARAVLHSPANGVSGGALAQAGQRATLPSKGPLADGDFTNAELTEVLHHVAVPFLPQAGERYLVEGYGALSDDAISHAKDVLLGLEPLPDRADDDAMNASVESARAQLMAASDCS